MFGLVFFDQRSNKVFVKMSGKFVGIHQLDAVNEFSPLDIDKECGNCLELGLICLECKTMHEMESENEDD